MTETIAPRRVRVLSSALDQVFSSVSNGFIVFAVGVVASPDEFGYVTILMSSLLAAMVCLRGALGLPLLLKADQSADDVRAEGSLALMTALMVGVLLAIAILTATPIVGLSAVALAVSAPFVLGQDVLRYVLMAIGRPQIAALWDGVWFLGTLLVLISTWLDLRFVSTASVLAGWGFFAAVAFVAIWIHLRLVLSTRGFLARLKPGWRDRVRYAAGSGLEQIGALVVLAIVATMLSPAATGALRGAMALMAPIGIFGSAVSLVLIPESVRSSASPRKVWRLLTRLAVFTALLTSGIGLLFYMLPPKIGFYLLGETFIASQGLLPLITAQFIAACLSVALGMWLRTFNRSAAALWLRIAFTLTTLIAAVVSALWIGSAVGVAAGLAVAVAAVAVGGLIVLSPWKQRAPAPTQVNDLVIDGPRPDEPPMITEPLIDEDVSNGGAEPPQATAAPARKKNVEFMLTVLIMLAVAVNLLLAGLYLVLHVF